MSAILASILRHSLTTIGGAIVAKYGLDANPESVAGAIATLAGFAWSLYKAFRK